MKNKIIFKHNTSSLQKKMTLNITKKPVNIECNDIIG